MKVCTQCNEQNDSNAAICKRCGASIEGVARTCPAGLHLMGSTWTECAYCKTAGNDPAPVGAAKAHETLYEPPRSGGQRAPTEVEGGAARADFSRQPPPPPRPVPGGKPNRETVIFNPQGGSAPANSRRIVALLITYTWKPEGEIFPIYEGRNLIGRKEKLEVSLPQDDKLSGENSFIMAYPTKFVLGDSVSQNGTDLNGQPVEVGQAPALSNYSTLRTGATHWTFIMIAPKPAEAPPAA